MADSPIEQSRDKHKGKKRRPKRQIVRVDLTPMVDLAFLLITFFMLTTSLVKPMAMPVDKRIDRNREPVSPCRVFNILADSSDRIYTYKGDNLQTLKQVDKGGIRTPIIEGRKWIKQNCGLNAKGQPNDMICLVKFLPGSRYKNMIDILDEIKTIDSTLLYSIQEPFPEEEAAVKAKAGEAAISNP